MPDIIAVGLRKGIFMYVYISLEYKDFVYLCQEQ